MRAVPVNSTGAERSGQISLATGKIPRLRFAPLGMTEDERRFEPL
jgi:hypothetical protein